MADMMAVLMVEMRAALMAASKVGLKDEIKFQ
jgi:hypothetical protein